MSSMDEIRQLFFVECEEQLESLTDGLAELSGCAPGDHQDETINTMFRAVHSIKGGAASFSLESITRFSHTFETVLDEARSGQLVLTGDHLQVFYAAADYLSDLVTMGAENTDVDPGEFEKQIAAISALSVHAADDGGNGSAEPDVLSAFEPMAMDFGSWSPEDALPLDVQGDARTIIHFAPHESLYANGHEPLHLIRELQGLGELSVEAFLAETGSWKDNTPSLSWCLTLDGPVDEDEIREIFEFCEPYVDLRIETVSTAAPEPLGAEEPSTPDLAFPEAPTDAPAEVPMQGAEDATPLPETDVPSAPDTASPEPAGKGPKATVRVDSALVDDLINLVGELVITQSVVNQSLGQMQLDMSVSGSLDEFRSLTRRIQEGIMAIRAQSVKPLFQRMGRISRETAQIAGKSVWLVTEGDDTEVDRTVIERLVDPLTHILRNSIDHGLESTEGRLAAGKSEQGVVRLSAAHRSGRVVIEIADDGAGINREKVLASAIRKGLVAKDATLSDADIDRLIFTPGFSTASEVSDLSGRGVGMDVVNNEIRRLGGRITIHSSPGEGTTTSISLPLTLAVLDGMVVDVAGQTMVIPISAITETMRSERADLYRVGPFEEMVRIHDAAVPIVDLARVFGFSDQPALERDSVLVMVEDGRGTQRALVVDRVHDQRQVVIKSLDTNYGPVPYVAAATILGDGHIALIVDVEEIATYQTPQRPARAAPDRKELSA